MNKTLFNTVPMALVMLASVSACSNDDMQDNGNGNTQLNIKLSETSESNDATRFIMADSFVVDSQQVDLGNGYVADVVITKDPTETNENTTRGYGDGDGGTYAAASGTYAIRAYDSNNKGTTYMGTWNGTTFTKVGNWDIKAGSYKMYCYQPAGWTTNESGNNLELSVSTETSNLAKQNRAVLSDEVNANISASSNTVAFNLKHKASGLRVKFNSDATLKNVVADLYLPFSAKNTFTLPDNSSGSLSTGATTTTKSLTFSNNASEYVYIPSGVPASSFQINFASGTAAFPTMLTGGSIDISLANKSISLAEFTPADGQRYTVNVTIKTSLYASVIYIKKAKSSETKAVQESWGTGTCTFGTATDILKLEENVYNGLYEYGLTANSTGKVDCTPVADAHSLVKSITVSDGSMADVVYTTNTATPITVQPKDHNKTMFKVEFLKKWQETDGVRYLRGRFTNNTPILLADGTLCSLYFWPYKGNSYFYTKRKDTQETTEQVATLCWEYDYDPDTKIYTIRILQDLGGTACNTTGLCNNNAYTETFMMRCPNACNFIKISDSLK